MVDPNHYLSPSCVQSILEYFVLTLKGIYQIIPRGRPWAKWVRVSQRWVLKQEPERRAHRRQQKEQWSRLGVRE